MTPQTSDESRKRSSSDFIFGKVIGEGSYSTVFLAKDIHTNKEYAIKVLEKRHIIREGKAEYVTREKNVLQILSSCSSFFVHLYCTFQDSERLYFVLTYAKNGELLPHINKPGNFSSACVQFYAAELLLAVEALNAKGIVHRDLKPENILFDENWHILITDFGSAKIVSEEKTDADTDSSRRRKNSFVGTAQYVSPELLNDTDSSYASDLWAYGCIIFQMVCSLAPFRAGSEYLIFQKILKLEYEFPEGFDRLAKDLVEKLLVLCPSSRLGASDEKPYSSIRQHKFFEGINWENLGPPPKMTTEVSAECTQISGDLEPGLDKKKVSQLQLESFNLTPTKEARRKITDLDASEIEKRLEAQKSTKWHTVVEGNLILKMGLVDKRKGFFARRRMLLLTLGPRLYYVDPQTMVLKGQIPWSAEIKPEPKNFKTFFVKTPNRTYYLEDPESHAEDWCKAIEEVKSHYFPDQPVT